ncbi:ABC transporter permease [Jatrophihabitans sp.]|uniref:ABC transporter permease n=1 Tax=Jatrophihabitans sp. TaxID=1932789 RepID=UPI0030C76341
MPAPAVPRPRGALLQLLEYQLLVARAFWRSFIIVGVLSPLLYVLALGIGLGKVVNRHGTDTLGVPYLQFVAPAFLVAAAIQVAANESTFPVMAGFKWMRTFHGMAATSLTPRQICDGQLAWCALRVLSNALLYLLIVVALGGAHRWEFVWTVPAATLTAMAFAAPVTALAAIVESEGNTFNMLFRFVVVPMFLFSGTFYPISTLPRWGQLLAYVTPQWHGTELARGAALGGLSPAAAIGHVAYLLVWLVVGVGLARWRFRVRLTK